MKYETAYRKLVSFGNELLNQPSLEKGIPLIADYARDVVGAERCSIFLYNAEEKLLWTMHSDGIARITISPEEGIVGHTFTQEEPIVANNARADKRFCPSIDNLSGFYTESIAAVPIFGSSRKCIGVFEMFNKKESLFDEEDIKFMLFFANFISGYLELAGLLDNDAPFF